MTEVEQLRNELQTVKDELRDTKDELGAVKTHFNNYRKAVSKKFSGHEEELAELESRFEDREPHPEGEETTLHRPEMLPIDRLAEAEDREDVTMGHVTESVERAVSIHQNFRQWSKKAPKGRVIKDNLKNLLSTATGETLHWRQVYRAARKLVEWSKESYTFKKTRRHGWILIQSSSVATGG